MKTTSGPNIHPRRHGGDISHLPSSHTQTGHPGTLCSGRGRLPAAAPALSSHGDSSSPGQGYSRGATRHGRKAPRCQDPSWHSVASQDAGHFPCNFLTNNCAQNNLCWSGGVDRLECQPGHKTHSLQSSASSSQQTVWKQTDEHTRRPCLEDHPNPSTSAHKGSPPQVSWPELASGSRSYPA